MRLEISSSQDLQKTVNRFNQSSTDLHHHGPVSVKLDQDNSTAKLFEFENDLTASFKDGTTMNLNDIVVLD